MKLSELFKRQNDTDASFDELEENLSNVIMYEMAPSIVPETEAVEGSEAEPAEDPASAEAQQQAEQPALENDNEKRTSGYTQARLAEFAVFEEMHLATQRELEAVSTALAKVKGAHHQTREFLNSVHAAIHRTSDLEQAAARLSSENRKLFRQAEYVVRLRSQLESLNAAFKRRETGLLETAEGLRASLSNARLELVEVRSAVARLEAERQDLMNSLANANSLSDRAARENEVLREKNINLAADLDTVSRKRTEAERRLDEVFAMHERDVAEIAELRSKLASSESERQRTQKQNDVLQARLVEVSEALSAVELELEEQAQRSELAMQGLKDERENLLSRLDFSVRAEQDAAGQIAELTARLNESRDAERLSAEKLAAYAEPAQLNGRGAPRYLPPATVDAQLLSQGLPGEDEDAEPAA